MTYDERQEIEEYLTIVEKNSQRLDRSIRMLREKLNEFKCELTQTNNDQEPVK